MRAVSRTLCALSCTAALVVASAAASDTTRTSAASPSYDGERLRLPSDYRQWVYLTSGFDMRYGASGAPDRHAFDNVFVDREAYRFFLRSGTWPDKTVFVSESREGRNQGSINRAGHFQAGDASGIEVHVKDVARFKDGWAFFAFDDDGRPAAMIPRSESCYACHAAHAAVDTTFVQFYPTLLPVAMQKKTLSDAYRKENPVK